MDILAQGLDVLRLEAEAVQGVLARLRDTPAGAQFVRAVELVHAAPGRVVVSGIGKSAHIAQKIVATMNSTGTPALFMHAAEALHGDLGMVQPGDVCILISKSGDTQELKQLVPLLSRSGAPVIALVGNAHSYLAKHAAAVLDASVAQEACPNNLAPTTSTTAALALGDALAVTLLQLRGFTAADFARYHPGGSLGKRLYVRVQDLLHRDAPRVTPAAGLREVIVHITKGRLGATLVVSKDGHLAGIVTDGDLRRMLERGGGLDGQTAASIMTAAPKTIGEDALAYDALRLMEKYSISQLVVADANGLPLGLLHFHDILREGIQ